MSSRNLRRIPKPGSLGQTGDFLTDLIIPRPTGRGAGNPDGIRSRRKIFLHVPPAFPNPTLDFVSHGRVATGLRNDDGHAPGLPGKFPPVEFEQGATLNASFVTNGQKFRPPTENTRPGKATITPRCGGRSGAPHLSAEGGDDPEPYGARSKPALPWFSCGHGSRTGVSVCAWRGCTSVSFE